MVFFSLFYRELINEELVLLQLLNLMSIPIVHTKTGTRASLPIWALFTNNMAEWKINFDSSVLEGHVKFREKKTVRTIFASTLSITYIIIVPIEWAPENGLCWFIHLLCMGLNLEQSTQYNHFTCFISRFILVEATMVCAKKTLPSGQLINYGAIQKATN